MDRAEPDRGRDGEETARSKPKPRRGRSRQPTKADLRPSQDGKPTQEQDDGAASDGLWSAAKRTVTAHPYLSLLALLLILAVVIAATVWWLNARQYETTDDAFIDARTVAISPQVSGQIVDLDVTDNQHVAKGGTLFQIDPRDYRAALDSANAQVEQARANIQVLDSQIASQQAQVEQAKKQVIQAESARDFSAKENARYQALLKHGDATQEQADQAATNLRQNQAAFAAAQASETSAEKQVAVLQAQRQQAKAALDSAKAQAETAAVNLERTTVKAPMSGFATEIKAANGAYAQAGQTMMMFVPDEVWVTANYKETALAHMRVGQPATIEIDAYPGRSFKGHVASIQAGSGAAFSLLPPENATGNYVKIVQRVPVKIVFDKPLPVYVGPGMSVVPSVKVR